MSTPPEEPTKDLTEDPTAGSSSPESGPTAPWRGKLLHDLKTPLNQIIGYSEMLEEEAEDEGLDGFVETLRKVSQAGRRLVHMLEVAFKGGGLPPADQDGASPSAARENPEANRAAAPSVSPVAPAQPSPDTNPEGRSQPAGGHLLVVDDNEMNRDMLSRRLRGKGYRVSVAEGGGEALKLLKEEDFDLVLLDVMMPEVSGLDVLTELRRTQSRADLPVIMATAKDQSDDIVAALRLGANDYVTKPLDFPVVLARTESQLALKRAMDEIQRLNSSLARHNRFIRSTFGRYLSDEIVDELLDSSAGLKLGGDKREVTILMSDLRGFTSMAEALTPEEVVRTLNLYLGTMVDVIARYRGTIDEFIGDAILVLFGAPVARSDDAARAVACAIDMQRAMASVNERFRKEGLPEVEMGVAVNTGQVVAGNIGSERRTKYGVVGSHVNLTSRIESYTVGGQVLISDRTREAVAEVVATGASLRIEAKGFKEPITVHDLRGIGAPFHVALPEARAEWRRLAEPLAVRFAVIEGKQVGAASQAGSLVELSERGGCLETPVVLPSFTNLRINLSSSEGAELPGDVYAKVVEVEQNGSVVIHFTSVPPEVRVRLDAAYQANGS